MNVGENTAGFTPNNALHGRDVLPDLNWNDAELLERAGQHAGGNPKSGSTQEAVSIRNLFEKHNLTPPTWWAAVQWVRRKEIPDRWRAVMIYMLLRDKAMPINLLFRKAPK